MDRVPTLTNDKTKVVKANADRPNGAGFAKLLFGALMEMSHSETTRAGEIRTDTIQAGIRRQRQRDGNRDCW